MAHFVRTPYGHTNILQPLQINEPKEGDYLCFKKDDEDWPVVICDEEIIQTFFPRSPRPSSARQAHGTWFKDYKVGGFSLDERSFPALYLGTLQLVWASLKQLEPIDIDMGRAIRDSTTNASLAKAWREYIGQYKGNKILEWKYLNHWKAKLHAQRLDQSTPGAMKKERPYPAKVPEGRKRKGTPTFKYPPGYRNEELDDEEPDDLFLRQEDAGGPKIKHEPNGSISSEEMEALYADPDVSYPTSSRSSKRSKLDSSGRFSMRPSTPSNGRFGTPISSSLRHETPLNMTNKKVDINDPNIVTIYVSNPHKKFKVLLTGLPASPFLSNLLTHHPKNGHYIMSPLLSSLSADVFRPVGEYIDRREYHPNILDDGTAHVRLEGDLTPDMLSYQVLRCGSVYQVAQMLEMPGLQELAFRKLRALTPHYRALEILTVVEMLFDIVGGGGEEIRRYLVRYVAEHYWHLVEAETKKMVEVMTGNEELAKAVFGMLSGREEGGEVKDEKEEGEDVKGEGEGKIQKKEEAALGETPQKEETLPTNPAAKVNDDAHKDGSMTEENTADAGIQPLQKATSDEAIHQTEEDMVKMALRQSEEEQVKMALRQSENDQTEEDWVDLVQKQSDRFEAF